MLLSRRSLLVAASAFSVSACQPFHGVAIAQLSQGTFALHGSQTVPFTLSGNHIYIRAMLGNRPYAFLFDTGGVASIVPELQAALHFPVSGTMHVRGVGAGVENVDIVRVPELWVGNLAYRGGSFLVLPLPFMAPEPIPGLRFGGIVGKEFFDNLVTTIDYEGAKLSFFERDAFHPDARAIALPLTFIDGHPSVPAAVNGHAGQFVIDAGARAGITVSRAFAESSGLAKDLGKTIEVVVGRGIGGKQTGSAARGKSLELGSLSLEAPPVMIAAPGGGDDGSAAAGSIGGEILRRLTITLDVANAKFYLRPNVRIGDPHAFNRAGVFSVRDAGVERVDLVTVPSPASEADVRTGDTIRSIDGVEIARLSTDRVNAIWQQPPGTKVALELERAGKTIRATLRLRDLL